MKKIYLLFCFLPVWLCAYTQDSVKYRIILIGDAGEINSVQQQIINDAISKAVAGKTMALFLGDNIYPKGVELDQSKKQASLDILRSQFEPFRKNNIPVYFVPGNHDWDKSGPNGYEKMQALNVFVKAQHDSLLQVIPANACPGPFSVPAGDNVLVVAMDSEWWLYPHDTHTAGSGCTSKTKEDVLQQLSEILRNNPDKIILFATHHPFVTYGSHGGYYSLKEHIFPLTDANKYFLLPLPVIGSLYPLVRKAFPPREDLKNALYQDMKTRINEVLATHPNVIHVSGHEHTLQLISDGILQVVSGAGCKFTPVKKGKGSLFATARSGYVLADVLYNNSIHLRYLEVSKKGLQQSFDYLRPAPAGGSKTTN